MEKNDSVARIVHPCLQPEIDRGISPPVTAHQDHVTVAKDLLKAEQEIEIDSMLIADGLVAAGQERCVLNPAPQQVSFAIHQIAPVVAPNGGGPRQSVDHESIPTDRA